MHVARSDEAMRRAGVALALTICLSASTARAVDGVIQINQARALAGGVTPGDTPGFPVTLSQAGSYRLTSNLDVTGQPSPENVTAISIAADHVSIDLNGFAILGPTTCSGSPPTCTPSGTGDGISTPSLLQDIAVKNGIVHGMAGQGINFPGAALVTGIQVSHCGAGIVLGAGTVSGNVVSRNGGAGITCGGACTASGNTVLANGGRGIQQNQGLVTANSIAVNRFEGLFLSSGATPVGYLGNVLSNNNSGGAQVSGGVNLGQNLCGAALCP